MSNAAKVNKAAEKVGFFVTQLQKREYQGGVG